MRGGDVDHISGDADDGRGHGGFRREIRIPYPGGSMIIDRPDLKQEEEASN